MGHISLIFIFVRLNKVSCQTHFRPIIHSNLCLSAICLSVICVSNFCPFGHMPFCLMSARSFVFRPSVLPPYVTYVPLVKMQPYVLYNVKCLCDLWGTAAKKYVSCGICVKGFIGNCHRHIYHYIIGQRALLYIRN